MNSNLTNAELKVLANNRYRAKNYFPFWRRLVCSLLLVMSLVMLIMSISYFFGGGVKHNSSNDLLVTIYIVLFAVTGFLGFLEDYRMSKFVTEKRNRFIKYYIEKGEFLSKDLS